MTNFSLLLPELQCKIMKAEKCDFRFRQFWAALGTKGHKKAELG
jgi:hypothetical protein